MLIGLQRVRCLASSQRYYPLMQMVHLLLLQALRIKGHLHVSDRQECKVVTVSKYHSVIVATHTRSVPWQLPFRRWNAEGTRVVKLLISTPLHSP